MSYIDRKANHFNTSKQLSIFYLFFQFLLFFVLAHVTSFAWKKCTYWFKQFYVQTAFFNRIFNDFWVTFVGWYSSAKTCLCCSKIANKLCNAMDSIMDMYYHRYLAIMFILGMYPNHYLEEKYSDQIQSFVALDV